jgi:hypothetical protein
MKIQEIVEKLNTSKKYIGFQLSKKNGLLNTTWLLYKKNDSYFFLDINQKIEFDDAYKYSLTELIKELEKSHFEIDLSIN